MIEVKFHKGFSKIYGVSLNEFKEATKEKYPYMQKEDNKKNAYGFCPLCENPVKLLGVYAQLNQQVNHARHCKKDIEDLADFNEYNYLKCPFHREHANYITEARDKSDITDFNKEILNLAHDYFDKCIYILSKITGLSISDKLAEEIAYDYKCHPGYMTYDITKQNIPYIMGICMTGKNLMNRVIEEDSPLYNMLKDKNELNLTELPLDENYKNNKKKYRIESKEGYLQLSFNMTRYRFVAKTTSNYKEYITLHIGIPDGEGTYKEYAKKEIEIDPFFFNKMINSKNKIPMNEKYREIADKYLVL